MKSILTFHSVDDTGSVVSISPTALDSLLVAIRRSGYRVVPLSTVWASDDPRQVALTFDDGYLSVAETALPILSRHGVTATLFLTTGRMGLDNQWKGQSPVVPVQPMMTWDHVAKLHDAGWAIEAHSVAHPVLTQLSNPAVEAELYGSKEAISHHLGVDPRSFAYPYGLVDGRVEALTRPAFELAVTTRFACVDAGDRPHRIPRLDAFYLRSSRVQELFGSRRFWAYLSMRGAIRRWRGHFGEDSPPN